MIKKIRKKLLLQKMQNAKIEIRNLHSGEHLLSPLEKSSLEEEEKTLEKTMREEEEIKNYLKLLK